MLSTENVNNTTLEIQFVAIERTLLFSKPSDVDSFDTALPSSSTITALATSFKILLMAFIEPVGERGVE